MDLAVLANHALLMSRDVRCGVEALAQRCLLAIPNGDIDAELKGSVKEGCDVGIASDTGWSVKLFLKVGCELFGLSVGKVVAREEGACDRTVRSVSL